MSSSREYINIQKLINESDSKFLKRMPFFMVWLIKVIIRQNEINRILNKYEDYEGIDFISKLIKELNIKVETEGEDNLPENGRCFFVANHPFGFADGLILTHTIASKYGDFRAIGNEVFTFIPHVKPIIAAVNVFGANPKIYLLELEKVFASEMPITHFPAGLVSRIINGEVKDMEWQKSFITKSITYQRKIVPLFFYGRNSKLFYFIYIARNALGIKTNIELVLLPYEFFNKRNKTLKVKIGTPIHFQTFDSSRTHFEWAQYVKGQVYNLKN